MILTVQFWVVSKIFTVVSEDRKLDFGIISYGIQQLSKSFLRHIKNKLIPNIVIKKDLYFVGISLYLIKFKNDHHLLLAGVIHVTPYRMTLQGNLIKRGLMLKKFAFSGVLLNKRKGCLINDSNLKVRIMVVQQWHGTWNVPWTVVLGQIPNNQSSTRYTPWGRENLNNYEK